MTGPMNRPTSTQPVFWRDSELPHVELRQVSDGRTVCYAPHTHTQWSMGAITGGESTFEYVGRQYHVSEGSLVFMNPEWVHACNPVDYQPWAYLMLYVDASWLASLRFRLGFLDAPVWQDIHCDVTTSAVLYSGFQALADRLLDNGVSSEQKEHDVEAFLSEVMVSISGAAGQAEKPFPPAPESLRELARYLDVHCTDELSVEWMAERAGVSPSHLVRVFRKYYGMTPHAYQINRRVQLGQRAIRQGAPIADAALAAGFFDQPHFQKAFKRLVAATPGQYSRPPKRHPDRV
ncbi:AraC family transcriptional regulator [Marinobacter sp. 1-4A]|uniref:AraC family transcriptional regulator n=1 Tax=Marinobacter sp. 1-4A TaxID=2582919 RepID=UPI001903B46F|nr:AraC family transcriptional regulator [Marinobacter sp. 1-4A]MBK1852323.1 AraC family transcriptional regulator [Marinobacter sp. 1-4A]